MNSGAAPTPIPWLMKCARPFKLRQMALAQLKEKGRPGNTTDTTNKLFHLRSNLRVAFVAMGSRCSGMLPLATRTQGKLAGGVCRYLNWQLAALRCTCATLAGLVRPQIQQDWAAANGGGRIITGAFLDGLRIFMVCLAICLRSADAKSRRADLLDLRENRKNILAELWAAWT